MWIAITRMLRARKHQRRSDCYCSVMGLKETRVTTHAESANGQHGTWQSHKVQKLQSSAEQVS